MKPIIKWAGGKTQLLPELLKRVPKEYNRYIEPFFGGGALFFALNPDKAILNDSNLNLMVLYDNIRDNPELMCEMFKRLEDEYNDLKTDEERSDFYYSQRQFYNDANNTEMRGTVSASATFLFLNKCGYNGLYRVNSKGEFNVPWGKKKQIKMFDGNNIFEVSKRLQRGNKTTYEYGIATYDKETLCDPNYYKRNLDYHPGLWVPLKDDFVFFDPPYYNTFTSYQKETFGEAEQKALAENFKTLTKQGVKCMLTNSNEDFIKDLYKDFKIEIVDVKRLINSDASNRVGKEIIVTNY